MSSETSKGSLLEEVENEKISSKSIQPENSHSERAADWQMSRYLDPSRIQSLLAGCFLAGVFYGGVILLRDTTNAALVDRILDMFLRPDNMVVIIPATILFFWALSILGIKRSSLRVQQKALSFALIPKDPQFSLNADTAQDVLTRLERTAKNPDRYLLLRRIRLSLSNLNNIGQISDVSEMLRGEAEEDEVRLDNSFSLVHSFVWAVPVLGFIGTAIGLSLAIGNFAGVLNSIGEVEELQASLGQVTSGLGTAFETTLVGLFFALVLHLLASIEEDEERRFLNECSIYCQEKIISRLKIRKD